MKPAFLQEAIKANALKKINQRERGEWKEPIIKQHKMTAEEFVAAKQLEKPRFMGCSTNMGSSFTTATLSASDPSIIKILERIQAELKSYRSENISLRDEVCKSKEELGHLRKELKAVVIENKNLRQDLAKFNESLQGILRNKLSDNESTTLLKSSKNNNSEILEDLQNEVNVLRSEVTNLRRVMNVKQNEMDSEQTDINSSKKSSNSDKSRVNITSGSSLSPSRRSVENVKMNSTSITPKKSKSNKGGASLNAIPDISPTIMTPKKSKANKVGDSLTSIPDISPTKSSSSSISVKDSVISSSNNPSIEPFSAEKIEFHQRKDEAFQKFIKTKEGLYPMKNMSILELGSSRVVCFKKRVYIPAKLRQKTVSYYKQTYGSVEGINKLNENCIWPDMELDTK